MLLLLQCLIRYVKSMSYWCCVWLCDWSDRYVMISINLKDPIDGATHTILGRLKILIQIILQKTIFSTYGLRYCHHVPKAQYYQQLNCVSIILIKTGTTFVVEWIFGNYKVFLVTSLFIFFLICLKKCRTDWWLPSFLILPYVIGIYPLVLISLCIR